MVSGEGLGGGYRTPPNRTRRERSELLMLRRSIVIHSQKVIHRRGVFGYLILVLLCQITDPALLVKLLPAAGGVGCALAFAVADFHLTDDLLQGSIPPG